MNEISKSALAMDAASRSPQSSSVMEMIQRFNPFVNSGGESFVNVTDERVFAALIDNFSDTGTISGDLVASAGGVSQMNISARDFHFEPAYIRRVAEQHAPYKFPVNVITLPFNDQGIYTNPADTSQTAGIVALSTNVRPLFGWAFRLQAVDTQRGMTSISITTNTGVTVDAQLNTVFGSAYIVVLNHLEDFNTTVNPTVTWVAGPPTTAALAMVGTQASVDDQFYFTEDSERGAKFSVGGINANITCYPLTGSRGMFELVEALYYADAMDQLALSVARLFQASSDASK